MGIIQFSFSGAVTKNYFSRGVTKKIVPWFLFFSRYYCCKVEVGSYFFVQSKPCLGNGSPRNFHFQVFNAGNFQISNKQWLSSRHCECRELENCCNTCNVQVCYHSPFVRQSPDFRISQLRFAIRRDLPGCHQGSVWGTQPSSFQETEKKMAGLAMTRCVLCQKPRYPKVSTL